MSYAEEVVKIVEEVGQKPVSPRFVNTRNFIRFHLLSKNPLCPNCGAVTIKKGMNRLPQKFKCPEGCRPVCKGCDDCAVE